MPAKRPPSPRKKVAIESKLKSKEVLTDLAQSLIDGDVDLANFATRFLDEIKGEYIRQYIFGKGGLDTMTSKDWGSIGGNLKQQYEYANDFIGEIGNEEVSEDGLLNRIGLYAESSDEIFETAYGRRAEEDGFTLEIWVLDNESKHCDDCLAYAEMGWVEIGTLPTPCDGSTSCMVNCGCYKEYGTEEDRQIDWITRPWNISKVGSEWCVFDKNGKKLHCYPTKQAAIKYQHALYQATKEERGGPGSGIEGHVTSELSEGLKQHVVKDTTFLTSKWGASKGYFAPSGELLNNGGKDHEEFAEKNIQPDLKRIEEENEDVLAQIGSQHLLSSEIGAILEGYDRVHIAKNETAITTKFMNSETLHKIQGWYTDGIIQRPIDSEVTWSGYKFKSPEGVSKGSVMNATRMTWGEFLAADKVVYNASENSMELRVIRGGPGSGIEGHVTETKTVEFEGKKQKINVVNGYTDYGANRKEKVGAQEMKREYQHWVDSLTPVERETLKGYAYKDFKRINNAARQGRNTSAAPIIDKALARSTLPENLVLRRDINSDEIFQGLKSGTIGVGSTLIDKGFCSTTIKEQTGFGVETKIHMTIDAAKGASGGYLESMASWSGEYEVLLPRMSELTITSVNDLGPIIEVRASYGK